MLGGLTIYPPAANFGFSVSVPKSMKIG